MREFLDVILGPFAFICGGILGAWANSDGWLMLSGVLMGFGGGWLLRWLMETPSAW